MPQRAIEKLDIQTRVTLRSSQILTSVPHVVSELVQNSLDAGAANIDIGVDCDEWICWVRDDGTGIKKESLLLLARGLEEGRYGSSKTYDSGALSSTFGFRGEGKGRLPVLFLVSKNETALASAADLGCLEISSRTSHSRESWSIIMKGSKNLYSGPAVRWRRESPGTTLPVRRLSHPPSARTLELVRQGLETYALVFPHVTFTLENISSQAGSAKGRTFRIPKHVETMDFQSDSFRLEGFISLNGAFSKASIPHFPHVNRHPIDRCDLHQSVDSAFAASTFGKNALDESGETQLPRSKIRRSPRKAEKKAVYVLNLTVPPADLDNCMEPAKAHVLFRQRDAVVELLTSCVTAFLDKNGFIIASQRSRSGSNRGSPVPRKRRKLASNDDSGFVDTFDAENAQSGRQNDSSFRSRSPVQPVHLYSPDVLNDDDQEILWADPKTGEKFVVNPRTGNSYRQAEPPLDDPASVSNNNRHRRTFHSCADNHSASGKSLIYIANRALDISTLGKANTSYDVGENLVRRFSTSTRLQEQCTFGDMPFACQTSFQEFRSNLEGPNSHKQQHRFKKEDLHRGVVINQVDTKFIACLIEGHGEDEKNAGTLLSAKNQVLVLIDQHAADERIRVERFLKDLCSGFLKMNHITRLGVLSKQLSPPLPILLTSHEAQRLRNSLEVQEGFRRWGFHFNLRVPCKVDEHSSDDTTRTSTLDYEQVLVESIPEVVSDKLLLGDELRDLVKGFLGQIETEKLRFSVIDSSLTEEGDAFYWLKALRWCPRELLDLINSKACRVCTWPSVSGAFDQL
ncbi:hypothetical protein H0H92_004893 [Tricholoma furcatifolium]|nr:hypothetical protein H0H92_004893 [Tricholoma furcatifolium]